MDEMNIEITPDMTFAEAEKIPVIAEEGPYMISGPGPYHDQVKDLPLREGTVLGWHWESMADGLNYLIRRAKQGTYRYSVYSDKEREADPKKADVHILHFPAKDRKAAKKRPWIIDCPGGAYVNVCAISEGYPVAEKFNALGYDVFVVNYRTGLSEVMPKPLDDLAACVRYVFDHQKMFDLGSEGYIVCGFSAGGNLAALWGTKSLGYAAYGLPKPVALFPIYPVADLGLFPDSMKEAVDAFLSTMFGDQASDGIKDRYSVLLQADGDYPPSYIACCKDDSTVPCVNSEKLYERLRELGVDAELEEGERGEHGFGDGRFSDVKDWMLHAAAFEQRVRKEKCYVE